MIYCDLDGVLTDFDGGFFDIAGKLPSEISRKELWDVVSITSGYWLNLKKMADADMLISYLSQGTYQILTGLPIRGYKTAEIEKRAWVKQHLGNDIKVICCLSKDKSLYCQKGDILIDDRKKNICQWEQAGGIGILHTSSQETIKMLEALKLNA